ncbi:MAG TPA: DUF333 domain-containing protein [Candidatus Moranbacteria bacterium]|nr:DUF333 domain-containing protein [Candidatus Moranbacteria bacterium]
MFNRKITSEIAVGIMLLIAIAVGGIFWWQNINNYQQKACTEEAKICPDGSAVGKVGPNCEFTKCPEEKNTQIANPASTYCVKNGGTSEIITAEDGSQTGYCKFSDGSECEEWAYFRKECSKGDSNDISNWQTYKNNEYGFEFKYPKGWEFKENLDNNEFVIRKGMMSPELKIQFKSEKYSEVLAEEKKFFNEYQQDNKELEQPTGEIKEGVLAGYATEEIFYYSPVGFIQKIIIFSRNDKAILINTYVTADLDKILSTFKFIY